ncbi:MAG TPA: glycine cleavage system protein H [Verrucomicrobiales bacterium]|nr:glycine cleavage system protein H [Verrucomicrobiales bacterium]
MEYVRFKHARFSARFPGSYRYSKAHYWMAQDAAEPALWRVGFTKFATRMLGELVEAEFHVQEGEPICPGQEIGSVEGFKAASDVYSVMKGHFSGMNPLIAADACIVRSDPYIEGWLYAARGRPEEGNLDAEGYVDLLGELITRMQAQEEHNPELPSRSREQAAPR